jgi:hypothetical protein
VRLAVYRFDQPDMDYEEEQHARRAPQRTLQEVESEPGRALRAWRLEPESNPPDTEPERMGRGDVPLTWPSAAREPLDGDEAGLGDRLELEVSGHDDGRPVPCGDHHERICIGEGEPSLHVCRREHRRARHRQ